MAIRNEYRRQLIEHWKKLGEREFDLIEGDAGTCRQAYMELYAANALHEYHSFKSRHHLEDTIPYVRDEGNVRQGAD